MNFHDLCHLTKFPEYREFCKNEWLEIHPKPGILDLRIFPNRIPRVFEPNVYSMKDDKDALGYLYILNELYNNGIKCVKPTFEQCLAFENVEINIPFKEYQQPYETMIVEYPEKYRSLLQSRYKVKIPIACTIHHPYNKEYMIGALSFGIYNYNITFYITNYDTVIEELVAEQNADQLKDLDFLPVRQTERVALNIMLFMMHFGSIKIGFENSIG